MWWCSTRSSVRLSSRGKIWQTLCSNLNCLGIICPYATIRDLILAKVQPPPPAGLNKVTVVGIGQVGMVCAFGILTQKVSTEVCLVDRKTDKVEGQTLDLLHGSFFLGNVRVFSSTDFKESAGSRLCIVAAGVRQKVGESRLALVQRNTEVMKRIIPKLVQYSPDAILLITSNPVDILSYVSWKLSGLPSHRIIGSGTNLDTSRFRYLLSKRLKVASSNCHGYIIGEHGDSSVAVWSGVNVTGVGLRSLNPKIGTDHDSENWKEIHKEVIDSAYKVIKFKGYTSWAIGMTVSSISASILHNSNNIHAVSILAKGYHGIEDEVYLSLPSVVGAGGVTDVIVQQLTDDERRKLHRSAKIMAEVQNSLKL